MARTSDETRFLNVDVTVESSSGLGELRNALVSRGFAVLHDTHSRRGYLLVLEADMQPEGAEDGIGWILARMKRLPSAARQLWAQAHLRSFDLGFEAGRAPGGQSFTLSAKTAAAVARAGADIGITIYASPRRRGGRPPATTGNRTRRGPHSRRAAAN